MMGIDPVEQRRMMQESLEAILALFRAAPEERISRHSDWFTLRDAQLHIRPYTWPYPEISTAAMISPSGPRLAGALGTSLLSLSMSVPGGYAALETTWEIVADQAEKSGRDEPDRAGGGCSPSCSWPTPAIRRSTTAPTACRISRTTSARPGSCRWPMPPKAPQAVPPRIRRGVCSQRQLLRRHTGDAIAYITDLLDRSGGFGTVLLLGHDWASPQATYHSYELFAREVMPHFKGHWPRRARRTTGPRACATNCSAAPARPSSRRFPSTPMS